MKTVIRIFETSHAQKMIFRFFLLVFSMLAIADIRTNIFMATVPDANEPFMFVKTSLLALGILLIIAMLHKQSDYLRFLKSIFISKNKLMIIARNTLLTLFVARYIMNLFFPVNAEMQNIYNILWATMTILMVFSVLIVYFKIKD